MFRYVSPNTIPDRGWNVGRLLVSMASPTVGDSEIPTNANQREGALSQGQGRSLQGLRWRRALRVRTADWLKAVETCVSFPRQTAHSILRRIPNRQSRRR